MVPLRWNSQDTPGPRPAVATPADFAPKTISTPAAAKPPQKPKDPKSIWDEDEAPAVEDTIDPADPRKRPQCVTCCVYFFTWAGRARVRECVSVSAESMFFRLPALQVRDPLHAGRADRGHVYGCALPILMRLV